MDVFQRIDLNGKIKDEFISVVYETKQHQILIGTSTKGLFVCDMNMKVQRQLTTGRRDFICLAIVSLLSMKIQTERYGWEAD